MHNKLFKKCMHDKLAQRAVAQFARDRFKIISENWDALPDMSNYCRFYIYTTSYRNVAMPPQPAKINFVILSAKIKFTFDIFYVYPKLQWLIQHFYALGDPTLLDSSAFLYSKNSVTILLNF